MVHTKDFELLQQTVEDIKWHKKVIVKNEQILNEICVFDAKGNGCDIQDQVFTNIAAAFNGQKQLNIPVHSRFCFSLFPMADDSVLAVIEEDGKAGTPACVWSIENLASNFALNGYLEYFNGISEEDFVASVLIESLKY